MSVPLWSRSAHPDDIRAEVAILGAGIAGVSAALECQRRGVSAVVIERGAIASGASSRNAGFLMRGAADNYAAGVRDLGRERTRALWKLSEANLASLIALGAGALPSFRRVPSCLVAMTESEAAELRTSAAMLRDDGFAAEIIDTHTDAVWRNPQARCGLVNPGDAVINPVDLVRHLAAQLDRPIIDHAEIAEVDRSGSDIVIRCATMAVRAPRVVVCLNAFVGQLFPEIAHWAEPNRGQMVAVRAPTDRAPISMAYYANHGHDYFRRVDDETVIFGGRRHRFAPHERTEIPEPTDEVQRSLEALARESLGADYPVVARWAGIMGFSPTGLPIVAHVPDAAGEPDERLTFCGGFTGHGMSLGFETARSAVAFALDGAPPPFPMPDSASPGR